MPNLLPFAIVAVTLVVCQHHIRRNPSASDDAWNFHGDRSLTQGGKTIVGKIDSISYSAPPSSGRSGKWIHRSGDGGTYAPSSKERPLLLEKNGRISFGQARSPMRFDARFGLLQ